MADKLQGDNSIDGGGSSSAAGRAKKQIFVNYENLWQR